MTDALEPTGRHPADVVADAVLACPAVAGFSDDGTIATFLPGRRVAGVRLDDDVCEVSVVLRLDGRPLPQIAQDVRTAVTPAVGARRVDVVVTDIADGVADDLDNDGDVDEPAAGQQPARP